MKLETISIHFEYSIDYVRDTIVPEILKILYSFKTTDLLGIEDEYNNLISLIKNIDNTDEYDKKMKLMEEYLKIYRNGINEDLKKYIVYNSKKISDSLYEHDFLGLIDIENDILKKYTEKYSKLYQKGLEYEKIMKEFNDNISKIKKYRITKEVNQNLNNKNFNIDEIPNYTISPIGKSFVKEKLFKFISLKVSTTGNNLFEDDIIEISATKFIDFKPIETFSTSIKHSNLENDNNPYFCEIQQDFIKFIKGYPIVGFNIINDLKFLFINNVIVKEKIYDTLQLDKKVHKGEYSYDFDRVCNRYNIVFEYNGYGTFEISYACGLLLEKEIKKIINE